MTLAAGSYGFHAGRRPAIIGVLSLKPHSGEAMRSMTLLRRYAFAGVGLVMLLSVAAPAAAYTQLTSSGDLGTWTFQEAGTNAGARCVYNASNFNFDKISVRGPVVGTHKSKAQRISWRFIVDRRYQIPNNDQYATETVYKSPIASTTVQPGHTFAFPRRAWEYPYNNPKGQFSAWVEIKWYSTTWSTVDVGTVMFKVEWYGHRLSTGASSSASQYYCIED